MDVIVQKLLVPSEYREINAWVRYPAGFFFLLTLPFL